jgi:hypothetical protein
MLNHAIFKIPYIIIDKLLPKKFLKNQNLYIKITYLGKLKMSFKT